MLVVSLFIKIVIALIGIVIVMKQNYILVTAILKADSENLLINLGQILLISKRISNENVIY